MYKLSNGTNEYEILGQITFCPTEDAEEQTNYTIIIDGETITVESTDPTWTVVEVADPEPVVEPEPDPEPVVLSEDEIARNLWLQQWQVYKKAKLAMQELAEAGFEPTAEETSQFEVLKTWVGANRRPEYSQYM